LIALTEDDCVVEAGWSSEAKADIGPAAAVGGAVEPGPYRRALDWAVYFCEYGRFMLPVPSALSGNNVVYSRQAIAALPEATRGEWHDAFVHAAWQRDSVPTRVNAAMVVRNVNSWSAGHVTSTPFHHGRAYAARRFGARSALARSGIALLTLGLPALKIARIMSDTLSRRRLAGRLALALPWILVFVVSWSAGECAGCLWGPGSSPSRWR
jgi:hypothetical protein